MIRVGAKELRDRQAETLDTAQREPVAIEKHGRPVAVIYSWEEANALEQAKLELLRWKIAKADQAIANDEITPFNQSLVDQIKAEGREKLKNNQ